MAIKSLRDNPYFAERAEALFEAVDYLPERPGQEELVRLLGEYDVLVIGARERVNREMLQSGPVKTSVIGTLSVGTDHLDLDALTEAGIHVERCPLANVRSVAEHALAMILALAKHLKLADRLAAEGKNRTDLPSLPFEVDGKTLGLIGYGNIGRTVGMLGAAIGMNVLTTTRSRQHGSEGSVRFGTLDDVLRQSHVISVSVPLTPQTQGLIDTGTLAGVRRGAILVNTSRAEVVVAPAVAAALDSGRLAGFAGDHDGTTRELVERPNVIITPHIAGLTVESNDRLDNELIDRLIVHFGGQT